jgi:putative copper resistance protein D
MSRLVRGRTSRRTVPAAAAVVLAGSGALLDLAAPAAVRAHGSAPPAPDAATLVTGWSFDAHVWLPLAVAFIVYLAAVRRVDRAHPATPVPVRRAVAWTAGLLVLLVALQSPIEAYDTTLFSVHMVQHLLLTMVAAPLLALGAPITLVLRAARPSIRRRWILPVLHSRLVRVIAFPVVAWVLFAAVMWVSHFSALFDAALESEAVHLVEHAVFLGSAMLFWWPVVGADPAPWRLPHPARVGYLFLGMPQSSFLGLAIFSSPSVLYAHYATLGREWGPSPLEDQQWAGGIMWAGGDLLFLVAMGFAVAAWLTHEEAEGERLDARAEQLLRAAGRRRRPAR